MNPNAVATFAAGCFWGTEHFFVRQFGAALISHKVGFMGGKELPEMNYQLVKKGDTGHAEVLQVTYNTNELTYDALLNFFFRMHNPTTLNRQEGDVGTQYRSTIFYHNEEQRKEAESFIEKLNGGDEKLRENIVKAFGSSAKVVTTLERASRFYPAEDYHQNYLEENPNGYCAHRLYW